MTELRVYLPIDALMPQFAAYLATPTRARGYPPMAGDMSLIVEVAPALAIHRIVDFALKAAPELEPGLLFTERQLVFWSCMRAIAAWSRPPRGRCSRGWRGTGPAVKPTTLFSDIVTASATSTPLSSTAPVKPR